MPDNPQQRRRGRWRLFTVHCLAVLALWPAFTGSFAPQELLLGAAAMVLTLAFMRQLERCMPVRVRFHVRDIVQLFRLPLEVVKDSWTLTLALLGSLIGKGLPRSRYRLLRWTAHPTTEEAQGRAVLLVTYLSSTPNSIVLGVDPGESLVVLHELTPAPAAGMARALGAQP